jgi:DNA-directed RNA polymerase specialized sigma24 family protein
VSEEDMPPVSRSQDVTQIDEELFRAWQSGDHDARNRIWGQLWRRYYTVSFAFCLKWGLNPDDAREAANDAYTGAWHSLEKQLRKGLPWTGEANFLEHVEATVIYRSRDALRKRFRWANQRDDLLGDTEEERTERLERLTPVAPNQGADDDPGEVAAVRTQQAVAHIITTLAIWKELCRKQPSLVAFLDAQLEYLRQCVAKSVTDLESDRDPETMTLDELLPYLDRDRFRAKQNEMNQFIMDTLKINRNQLDTRRRKIRQRVGPFRPPGSGSH